MGNTNMKLLIFAIIFIAINGIVSAEQCYQETANQTNVLDGDCNLNYSGGYSYSNNYVNINYIKPMDIDNATWRINIATGISNIVIPDSCLNYNNNLSLRVYTRLNKNTGSCQSYGECYDGSWQVITTIYSGSNVCEIINNTDNPSIFYDANWTNNVFYEQIDNSWAYCSKYIDPIFTHTAASIKEEAIIWGFDREYTLTFKYKSKEFTLGQDKMIRFNLKDNNFVVTFGDKISLKYLIDKLTKLIR